MGEGVKPCGVFFSLGKSICDQTDLSVNAEGIAVAVDFSFWPLCCNQSSALSAEVEVISFVIDS